MEINRRNRQENSNNLNNIRQPDTEQRDSQRSNSDLEYETIEPRKPHWAKKHYFWIGITALITFVGALFLGSTKNYSMQDVVSNGIGKGMPAGTTLISKDEGVDLTARDFDIKIKQGKTSSRVLIWDFASEDGDVVTVKVNGVVVASNIGIMNTPVPLEIPIPSKVEIVGVKDGVGGITYGIKFPGAASNNSYFNIAPEGSANTYNLTIP
ncbi:hypothetical protein [Paenibacillus sp. MMO-58]|uniref:hypothetical protein n=1 Tax=Paenibacillus sp. MMO-58 TaxID=3081290 RepID=UPI00301B5B32